MNQWNKPPLGSIIDHEHPLSRGLAGCWLMNEGSGNRIYDLSGNGNDGVLTNGPLWKPGRNGAAIELDGNTNHINFGNGNQLKIGHGTWSSWIYPTSFADHAYHTVLSSEYSTGFWFGLYQNSGRVQLWVGGAAESSAGAVALNVPSLITATWDGITIKYYINGRLDDLDALTAAPIYSAFDLWLGRDPGSPALYQFTGKIDDVRIWNRALSAQEVQDLYINPYGFIWEPQKYWLMPQGVTIPPHLFRRVA